MKTNLEKVSSLERKLNVEMPVLMVQEAMEKQFKKVQREAHIKGFRPGKAPMATIKSIYGDAVRKDAIQDLLQQGYVKGLDEHSLDPISYPRFDIQKFNENEDFVFSAQFEIRPEIHVAKYESLEIEKEKVLVDEAQLDQILQNIQSSRAELVPVLELRSAQAGDIALIDFTGRVDGKELQNGKGENHPLELGSHQFIPGFEDGVMGMSVGQTKTINLTFPTPYHSKELEGKPVQFEVTLKELKKKVMPELNDEFVKALGSTEQTLEELKSSIRKDIEHNEQRRIEEDQKNAILKALVKANPVEVPPSMMAEQKQALIQDITEKLQKRGMGEEEIEDYKKKWDPDFEASAKEMIQAGFLVDEIAKKHELICKTSDIEERLQKYAAQSGLEIEKVREYFSSNEQKSRMSYQITEEKVVQFLLNKAVIKEVNPKPKK